MQDRNGMYYWPLAHTNNRLPEESDKSHGAKSDNYRETLKL